MPEIRDLRPSLCHDQGKAIIRCNSLIRHLIHRQAQRTDHNTNAQCHQANRQSRKLHPQHHCIKIIKERSNIRQAHRIHNRSNSQEPPAKGNFNDQQHDIYNQLEVTISHTNHICDCHIHSTERICSQPCKLKNPDSHTHKNISDTHDQNMLPVNVLQILPHKPSTSFSLKNLSDRYPRSAFTVQNPYQHNTLINNLQQCFYSITPRHPCKTKKSPKITNSNKKTATI